MNLSGKIPVCIICLTINVKGASKYNVWYFNCIIDIPSHPQLFLGGKVSIILLMISSFTSWNVKTLSLIIFKYEAYSFSTLVCISLAKLMPIFVKYRLKLFAISKLSVTLDCSTKK